MENILLTYIIVSSLVLILIVVSYMFSRRFYYASVAGKVEHHSARWLGLMIAVTFYFSYINSKYVLYLLIVDMILWSIYFLSHTLEKSLYGHSGPRG